MAEAQRTCRFKGVAIVDRALCACLPHDTETAAKEEQPAASTAAAAAAGRKRQRQRQVEGDAASGQQPAQQRRRQGGEQEDVEVVDLTKARERMRGAVGIAVCFDQVAG